MCKQVSIIFGILLATGLICSALAQLPMSHGGLGAPSGGGGRTCTDGTASTNFLARTSGLSNTDKDNYCTLINGLVTDTIITGNLSGASGCGTNLDGFFVFAAPDTTTAQLNLCGTAFGATLNGSPAFTAYNGYLGVDSSSTVFINTNYNPTNNAINMTGTNCHIMAWSNTNTQSTSTGGVMLGMIDGGGNINRSIIQPWYSDGNGYFGCANSNFSSVVITQIVSNGQFVVDRTGNTALAVYRNASSILSVSDAGGGLNNINLTILADNVASAISGGGGRQIAVVSWGKGLGSTNITNFYNRLRTYLTAVGCTC